MFLENPEEAPPLRKPPLRKVPHNVNLCEHCNRSLYLDDGVVEEYVTTSIEGEKYIGNYTEIHLKNLNVRSAFGGIDYIRRDVLPDLPRLSSDADFGCQFCSALKDALLDKYRGSSWWKPHPDDLIIRIQYSWSFSSTRSNLNAVVVSVFHPELGTWQKQVFQFLIYVSEGEDLLANWLNPRRKLKEELTWSSKNISMVRSWLYECNTHSGNCSVCHWDRRTEDSQFGKAASIEGASDEILVSTQETPADEYTEEHRDPKDRMSTSSSHYDTKIPFSPTRILDLCQLLPRSDQIHPPDCRQFMPDDIVLVETHDEEGTLLNQFRDLSFKYAALSYCWGIKEPPVKTTKATLSKNYVKIDFSDLPQCLRDAVTVARSLGIRYLWVDALCIIQDDNEDWSTESGKMYEVFSNAYITIGAAASESFHEGFLGRAPQKVMEIEFQSSLNPEVVGKLFLSLTPAPGIFNTPDEPLDVDLRLSKWDTRGWVWQEQQLSRRLLVFGRTMIHLKCDHCTRSENGFTTALWSCPPHTENRILWQSTLREYSRKNLTKLSDKLPAISGVAKLMDQNSKTYTRLESADYLAGIWSDRWRIQLCWKREYQRQSFRDMVEGFKAPERSSDLYVAPSWSWASRHGGANWQSLGFTGDDANLELQAQIDDYLMIQTGSDPHGRVAHGSFLRLSGLLCGTPLKPGVGIRLSDDILDWWIPGSPVRYSLDWNCCPEDGEGEDLVQDIRMFTLWVCEDMFGGLLLLQDKDKDVFYRTGGFLAWSGYRLEDKYLSTQYELSAWKRQSVHIV